MFELEQTDVYRKWRSGLRDRQAVARIAKRVARLKAGLAGDVKPVGQGVSELRIDYGPGYRVYFTQRGKVLILLLCGGDKSSQAEDIEQAKALKAALDD
jgi:putative addiction module killer protein